MGLHLDTFLERTHGPELRVLAASGRGFGIVAGTGTGKTLAIRPIAEEIVGRPLRDGEADTMMATTGGYPLYVVELARWGRAQDPGDLADVVAGIRLLARTEGIFAETAGGVTVACAKKLVESGQLDPDAETVLLITGDGLKTLDAVENEVGPRATVAPTARAVIEALDL